MSDAEPLRAVALNCTLKGGAQRSSTERMLALILEELRRHGVAASSYRVRDHDVRFGVTSDEGDGDGWPTIREAIVGAEILVIGTPIWLGHPSSVCQVVLERLDAFISETQADSRPVAWDRVAVLGVVGNEDGAHAVTASVFQGLNDVGFTIPAGGAVYWVGEAMGDVDFADLDEIPEKVRSTARNVAANAAHAARVLRSQPYPAP